MSLLDALLLDPLRVNIWIAARTDGIAGTGTQNDPYDAGNPTPAPAAAAAKFDAIMNGLPSTPPVRVHLGPGTFYTNGYADGVSGGWQIRSGMKIVGSGIDVTTVQLVGSSTDAHYYAMGHALSTSGSPTPMDFFEVTDLTIDCHYSGFSGGGTACGAVRVMGNHCRIHRIKAINWGTKTILRPCFVLLVVTANPPGLPGVEDCGIEECIGITPDPAYTGGMNVGPSTVFHAGGWEATPDNVTGYGIGPYIRNCFADGGLTDPSSPEIRGLSMAWCKAGVVEGNQIHNAKYGVFQQQTNGQDIVIRNNWFKNVYKGVLLGATLDMFGLGTLNLSAPTVTASVGNDLQPGDFAWIKSTGTPYDGRVVQVLASPKPTSSSFAYHTSITSPSSATLNDFYRVFGVATLIIEGNVVELNTSTSAGTDTIIGIHLNDAWGTTNPLQDGTYPVYVFTTVIVRDNKIRYVDGQTASNYVGYPVKVTGAADLQVRNNVVEYASSITNPIRNARCGAATYFNNQTPAGALVLGWNLDNSTNYEELSTITDFALVMGLFNKKA
jgi:hypothetical protein